MSETVSTDLSASEYTQPDAVPRRAKAGPHRSYRALRLFYFFLAGIWGFVIGVGGLAAALMLQGSPISLSTGLVLILVPFGGFALGGAAVASMTYREARRRCS